MANRLSNQVVPDANDSLSLNCCAIDDTVARSLLGPNDFLWSCVPVDTGCARGCGAVEFGQDDRMDWIDSHPVDPVHPVENNARWSMRSRLLLGPPAVNYNQREQELDWLARYLPQCAT